MLNNAHISANLKLPMQYRLEPGSNSAIFRLDKLREMHTYKEGEFQQV